MVVIPAMLTHEAEVASLVNSGCGTCAARTNMLRCSPTLATRRGHMPDQRWSNNLGRHQALNAKHGRGARPFYLFHQAANGARRGPVDGLGAQ
jgi:hypothetical protein